MPDSGIIKKPLYSRVMSKGVSLSIQDQRSRTLNGEQAADVEVPSHLHIVHDKNEISTPDHDYDFLYVKAPTTTITTILCGGFL